MKCRGLGRWGRREVAPLVQSEVTSKISFLCFAQFNVEVQYIKINFQTSALFSSLSLSPAKFGTDFATWCRNPGLLEVLVSNYLAAPLLNPIVSQTSTVRFVRSHPQLVSHLHSNHFLCVCIKCQRSVNVFV
jgi:hypothetical protein